ncbi:DUF5994 family protein [Nocardia terpenica]|uniref:DUF5994 family protein n=1 Tax=Nocardia terpenica TaxID=455432 RepID=UPI0018E068A0|nr:DUF5994 family protein [Nocardia terpenica]
MTTRSSLPHTGRHPPITSEARLRLRSDASIPGHIDGAWWPRRDDLAAELPDLLNKLRLRLGPIHRVTYHLPEWPSVPRRLTDDGRHVRLDGYRFKPAHTLDVLGVSGDRIDLLVIPPNTSPDVARATMRATTHPAHPATAAELLETTARTHNEITERQAAERTWDAEGGATFD